MVPIIIILLQWEFLVTTMVIFFSVDIASSSSDITGKYLNAKCPEHCVAIRGTL